MMRRSNSSLYTLKKIKIKKVDLEEVEVDAGDYDCRGGSLKF